MDVGRLILSFATAPSYPVTRRARNPPVRGVVQPPTVTTLAIVASVQPATGKDLLRLPEGRRSNETRVLFTLTQLLVGGQGDPNEADQLTIDGQQWEVQHVETWEQATQGPVGAIGSNAYRCIVQAMV